MLDLVVAVRVRVRLRVGGRMLHLLLLACCYGALLCLPACCLACRFALLCSALLCFLL